MSPMHFATSRIVADIVHMLVSRQLSVYLDYSFLNRCVWIYPYCAGIWCGYILWLHCNQRHYVER